MEFSAYDIALVPILIALVEVIGRLGVSSRFQPAVALILGIIAGLVYVAPDDPARGILVGMVMGLSAIGAHSGIKNTIEKR